MAKKNVIIKITNFYWLIIILPILFFIIFFNRLLEFDINLY